MDDEELVFRLKRIKDKYAGDTEMIHVEMDKLMCDILIDLGFKDGVEIIRNTNKWYA